MAEERIVGHVTAVCTSPETGMRKKNVGEGCLIEAQASPNIYGLPVQDIAAQIPQAFPNGENVDLDGIPAVLSQQANEDGSVSSEWVHVVHHDRTASP